MGTFSVGMVTWGDLKDLNSAIGGSFDTVGFSLEGAGHKHVGRWGDAYILVGADLGFFATDSSIPTRSEDLFQRGLFLTPSVKFRFGEPRKRRLNLEVGAGWYLVDFAELDCRNFNPCEQFGEPFENSSFGGYVGVSGGFGWFIMGLRAHFVDFGEVAGLGPDAGSLGGPVLMISVGGSFGG